MEDGCEALLSNSGRQRSSALGRRTKAKFCARMEDGGEALLSDRVRRQSPSLRRRTMAAVG
ncbi:hypothetical protein HN51_041319, partial [Arachis hypogaea]